MNTSDERAIGPLDCPVSGCASAILREIEQMLQRLLAAGQGGSIDLSALPLGTADVALLARELGEGEVSASIRANGLSLARETFYAGIWWVTHQDDAGAVVAQFIEVCAVPELVKSQPVDMADALVRLRQRAAQGQP